MVRQSSLSRPPPPPPPPRTHTVGVTAIFHACLPLSLLAGLVCVCTTVLGDRPDAAAPKSGKPSGLTADEIAAELKLKTTPGFRGVTDWLDVLVSLDTLQRTGN